MPSANRIFQWASLATLLIGSGAWLAGCGGSASETPPPLEPDPHAHATPTTSEATPARPSFDTEPTDTPAAPGTWGTGRHRAQDGGAPF